MHIFLPTTGFSGRPSEKDYTFLVWYGILHFLFLVCINILI